MGKASKGKKRTKIGAQRLLRTGDDRGGTKGEHKKGTTESP